MEDQLEKIKAIFGSVLRNSVLGYVEGKFSCNRDFESMVQTNSDVHAIGTRIEGDTPEEWMEGVRAEAGQDPFDDAIFALEYNRAPLAFIRAKVSVFAWWLEHHISVRIPEEKEDQVHLWFDNGSFVLALFFDKNLREDPAWDMSGTFKLFDGGNDRMEKKLLLYPEMVCDFN